MLFRKVFRELLEIYYIPAYPEKYLFANFYALKDTARIALIELKPALLKIPLLQRVWMSKRYMFISEKLTKLKLFILTRLKRSTAFNVKLTLWIYVLTAVFSTVYCSDSLALLRTIAFSYGTFDVFTNNLVSQLPTELVYSIKDVDGQVAYFKLVLTAAVESLVRDGFDVTLLGGRTKRCEMLQELVPAFDTFIKSLPNSDLHFNEVIVFDFLKKYDHQAVRNAAFEYYNLYKDLLPYRSGLGWVLIVRSFFALPFFYLIGDVRFEHYKSILFASFYMSLAALGWDQSPLVYAHCFMAFKQSLNELVVTVPLINKQMLECSYLFKNLHEFP